MRPDLNVPVLARVNHRLHPVWRQRIPGKWRGRRD